MSDLFEKRVEAAAKALHALVEDDPFEDFHRDWQEMYRTRARATLIAADAVVTEEMIAETILKALVFTNENSKPWADGLARDIAALFRGGAK